jgi:serine/threonine-protein kinase
LTQAEASTELSGEVDLAGDSLPSKLTEPVLTQRQAAGYLLQATKAVAFAHGRGVLHRDIKPANIVIESKKVRAYVVDFGLAKLLTETTESDSDGSPGSEPSVDVQLTRGGLGTMGFMAPEQARDARQATVQSDIYSLGSTLCALLTGRAPDRSAKSTTDFGQVFKQAGESAPPQRFSVDRDLEAICLTCLQDEADQRYSTAEALGMDLQRYLNDEPVAVSPRSYTVRLWRFCKRKPAVASAATAIILLLITLSVGGPLAAWKVKKQRKEAQDKFQMARDAVDESFTTLSETRLLDAPGLQPLRKQLLQSALKYYLEFAKQHRDDPALQAELASAHFRVGNINHRLGLYRNARVAFEQSREIYVSLLRTESRKPEFKCALADALVGLGDVETVLDRPKDALRFYQQATGVYQPLVVEHRKLSEARRGLARAYMRVSINEADRENTADSIDLLRQSIDLLKPLARSSPVDSGVEAELATCYTLLGLVLHEAGKMDQSLKAYRQALNLFVELRRKEPGVLRDQVEMGRCYLAIAVLQMGRLDWLDAIKSCEDGIEILGRLVDKNPAVPSYRQLLIGGYDVLVQMHKSAGREAHASQTCRRLIDFLERLPVDLEDFEFQQTLARAYADHGAIQFSCLKPLEAATAYKHAIDLQKRLVERQPMMPSYRSELAAVLCTFASDQLDTGELARPLHLYREAIDIYDALRNRFPEQSEYQRNMADALMGLGACQHKGPTPAQAVTSYRAAVTIRQRLVDRHTDVLKYRLTLALDCLILGSSLAEVHQADDAAVAYEQGIEQCRSFIAQLTERDDSQQSVYSGQQRQRASALQLLATLQRNAGKPEDSKNSINQSIVIYSTLDSNPKCNVTG